MESNFFSFRFDVDTHKCIEQGIPALIQLGRETGARFSFFVTMGRAVSRRHYIKKIFGRGALTIGATRGEHTAQRRAAPKLSNFRKLGSLDYFRAAVLNPDVGRGHVNILKLAETEGHEIGLHGGTNHAVWQEEALSWGSHRVEDEIGWGLEEMRKAGLRAPLGFSSPGWQSPGTLSRALKSRGFAYKVDRYSSEDSGEASRDPTGIIELPTNIVGDGGVGFIESCRASGQSSEQILDTFKERLCAKRYAVVYDHPYYAGVQELPLVRQMVLEAQKHGFKMVTLSERLALGKSL